MLRRYAPPAFISFVVLFLGSGFLFIASPSPSPHSVDTENLPAAAVASTVPTPPAHNYIEVTGGCGPHFEDACVNVRAGADITAPIVFRLRNGIVLPVSTTTVTDSNGRIWYKITFNEWVRYPDRISSPWFVAADHVHAFDNVGDLELGTTSVATSSKTILIDRSEQKLYAYEGNNLFLETSVSTGLDLTPTPRGDFTVFKKTPSRYMQGPLPEISDEYYDLPGVPWNLYFTEQGGAIHGAYWHDSFGQPWSHGCVNLPLDAAKQLYEWAPLGTTVKVRD